MPIQNTVRLSQADVDLMNGGFRRIGYAGDTQPGRINDRDIIGTPAPPAGVTDDASREVGLAEHFGVSPATVRTWLLPGTDKRSSNLVIPRDGNALPGLAPPFYGAIGKRVYCLNRPLISDTDKRNSLRQRIFLGAALCAGGLVRVPIHKGGKRYLYKRFLSLSACLQAMYTIWDGGENDFLKSGWTSFTIVGKTSIGNVPGWQLTTLYNEMIKSDEVREEEQEDDSNDYGDGNGPGADGPGCP